MISEENKKKLALKREMQIEELFGREKPVYKRLGCGIHKDQFYFGTTVYIDEVPYSAVVTSSKEVYIAYKNKNQIKEKFGLNYRTEFEEESLDFPWSQVAIREYLLDKHEKKPLKEIFADLKGASTFFVYYPDKRIHDFNACWTIASYGLSLYSHAPRTQFRGKSGSGKSKASELLHLLAFNAFKVSSTSDSDLFRSIEGTAGTPIIDNFDHVQEDLKKAIKQNYETGFDSEGTYRRRERNKAGRFTPGKFSNYCSMVLNGIQGLEGEAVENRSLIFNLTEPPSETKEIKEVKNRWPENSPSFDNLRNDLRNWWLDNWETVKKSYREIKLEVSGREQNLVKPILVIAKLVSPTVSENVSGLCLEKLKEQKTFDRENSEDFQLFSLLDEIVPEKGYFEILNSELVEKFLEKYCGDIIDQDTMRRVRYGLLRRLSALLKLTGQFNLRIGHANKLMVCIEREKLDYVLKSRNYKEFTTENLPNQPNPTNQPNQANQANQPNPTNPNGKKSEKGESGGVSQYSGRVRQVRMVRVVRQKCKGEEGLEVERFDMTGKTEKKLKEENQT